MIYLVRTSKAAQVSRLLYVSPSGLTQAVFTFRRKEMRKIDLDKVAVGHTAEITMKSGDVISGEVTKVNKSSLIVGDQRIAKSRIPEDGVKVSGRAAKASDNGESPAPRRRTKKKTESRRRRKTNGEQLPVYNESTPLEAFKELEHAAQDLLQQVRRLDIEGVEAAINTIVEVYNEAFSEEE